MRTRLTLVAALSLLIASGSMRPTNAANDKAVKETLTHAGRVRTYYVLAPDNARPGPAPLVVLLHGSGRDGRSLLDPWTPLARKAGIILVGLESVDRRFWTTETDGPDFIYAAVEAVRAKYPVDPKCMYLFGHSAGATFAIMMALLESEYFAAVAAHAGVLPENLDQYLAMAPRKTPIGIWVGTNDAFFPLAAVRATRDALVGAGFPAQLEEIKGHTHDYYGVAPDINARVWQFLRSHALEADPKYKEYDFAR
jgi:poly(3-hydroxybutyrate) depolymerase